MFWNSDGFPLALCCMNKFYFFLSLIWVLGFLDFSFRGKMNQASISDLLKTPLSAWSSVLDQVLLHRYLVQTFLMATRLGCCLPCVYGSSTLARPTALPPFLVYFGFTEPLLLSSQHQESSLWETICGPPAPGLCAPFTV